MAQEIVICKYCGMEFSKSDTEYFTIGRRYAHMACHKAFEEKQNKEIRDYELLVECIKKIFKLEILSAKIEKQIRDFIAKYNYDYTGIRRTLEWWFILKRNPTTLAQDGIGIVPFVYNEALEYFHRLEQANEFNESAEIKKPHIHEVVISPPTSEREIKLFK